MFDLLAKIHDVCIKQALFNLLVEQIYFSYCVRKFVNTQKLHDVVNAVCLKWLGISKISSKNKVDLVTYNEDQPK